MTLFDGRPRPRSGEQTHRLDGDRGHRRRHTARPALGHHRGMELRLFDWGQSPFCLKVRAILDYKGLRYQRRSVLGSAMIELRRRGGSGKVPALDLDGQLIVDSTDIAYALEPLAPPAIIPVDARERAQCHVIEDWA